MKLSFRIVEQINLEENLKKSSVTSTGGIVSYSQYPHGEGLKMKQMMKVHFYFFGLCY